MPIPAPLEKDVLRQCLQFLRLHGVWAWRNNTTGTRRQDASGRTFWAFHGEKGASDVFAILPGGRFLAVEVKRPGGRASEAQLSFLDEVNRRGGLGVVVDGVDKLEAALRAEGVI